MTEWHGEVAPQPLTHDPASKDLMIDIETLGTKPGCVVLSAVGIWFDRAGNGKTSVAFSHSYDIERQITGGSFIDPATAKWWFEQPASAFLEMAKRREATEGNMAHASLDIDDTLARADRVWSCGPDFDPPILNALFSGIKWPHWKNRDVRTMRDLLTREERTQIQERWVDTLHNPEADCHRQIEEVITAYRKATSTFDPYMRTTGNST